jgi:hypothetical protein
MSSAARRAQTATGYRQYAAPVAANDWSATGLRARCAILRDGLVARDPDLAAALAAYWPGGAENPGRGRGAWIVCFGEYRQRTGAAFARAETRGPARDERLQRAVRRASTDRREPVTLDVGRVVHVHPKSFRTHEVLSDLDGRSRVARDGRPAVAEAAIECGLDPMPTAALRPARRRGRCVVLDRHDAGRRAAVRRARADPVRRPRGRALSAIDVVRLVQAFRRVDHETIAVMSPRSRVGRRGGCAATVVRGLPRHVRRRPRGSTRWR